VLFLLFLYSETHVQDPILPLDLFKNQVFFAGALLSLLVGMALFSIIVYLPLFVQAVQGQSPTSSGAIMTPLTFTIAILSIITGSVVSKIGRYQMIAIIGSVILAGGVFFMTQMNAATSSLEIKRTVPGSIVFCSRHPPRSGSSFARTDPLVK
jgi:MFS family permease